MAAHPATADTTILGQLQLYKNDKVSDVLGKILAGRAHRSLFKTRSTVRQTSLDILARFLALFLELFAWSYVQKAYLALPLSGLLVCFTGRCSDIINDLNSLLQILPSSVGLDPSWRMLLILTPMQLLHHHTTSPSTTKTTITNLPPTLFVTSPRG